MPSTPATRDRPRVVYLSRTSTPGSVAVSEETVRYLLTEAERMAVIRAISAEQ